MARKTDDICWNYALQKEEEQSGNTQGHILTKRANCTGGGERKIATEGSNLLQKKFLAIRNLKYNEQG